MDNPIQNINELTDLQAMIAGGFITARKHPRFDLTIYNYTDKAQYGNVWNEATMNCRGLIADGAGQIVARPFRKFFNLEQLEHDEPFRARLRDELYEVFEKVDGCLGVMYWVDGNPYLSSRGSFTSDVAAEGNKMLNSEPYWSCLSGLDPAYTYLFEIVCPTSRIVVDYGGDYRLVLIGAVHTQTGEEKHIEQIEWPDKAARYAYSIASCYQDQPENFEGYVVRFESGYRVKIKTTEYVRLHKILTGITERTIWRDYLLPGHSIEPLLEQVPDEFHQWVLDTVQDLNVQKGASLAEATGVAEGLRK